MTGLAFITEQFVEGEGGPPPLPGDEYIVFGFPDSNPQFKPDRRLKNIKQNSVYFQTVAKPPEVAARVGCSLESHLFLEFDPEDISVAGKRYNPPNPRGISGGAAFCVVGETLRLVGIMTADYKDHRTIVGVRMSEVIAIAENIVKQ